MCIKFFRLIGSLGFLFISVHPAVNSAEDSLALWPDIDAVTQRTTGNMGDFAQRLYKKVHQDHECGSDCEGEISVSDLERYRSYERSVNRALSKVVTDINTRLVLLNTQIRALIDGIGHRIRMENQFWKNISIKKYVDAFGMADISADLKELAKTKALSKVEKYAWKSTLTNEALSELYADHAREIIDSFPVGEVSTHLNRRLDETRNALILTRERATNCINPDNLAEATSFINAFQAGGIRTKLQREFDRVLWETAPGKIPALITAGGPLAVGIFIDLFSGDKKTELMMLAGLPPA